MAHLAFVKHDLIEDEWRTCEIAVQREECRDGSRPPIQSRKRDVGHERSRLGCYAHAAEQLIDLAVERGNGTCRLDPRPYHMRPAMMLEQAYSDNARRNRAGVESAERCGDIFGAVTIDLADEAQGQMQLFVFLPAGARNPVHRRDQLFANRAGRAQGDEQAVRGHGVGKLRRFACTCEPETAL